MAGKGKSHNPAVANCDHISYCTTINNDLVESRHDT